tara:strand:+ start:201 stop:914 length:714 start_codon:yes stop_codon:yes gene_type:complete
MCDPITMGVVAGAGAGTAAYAGVLGTAATGSLMTAASIGLTVGSGVMQVGAAYQANKADRISAGLQERQYDEQVKRYKAQAEAQELETMQQITARKRDYLRTLSSNRAWMGASGATMDSASFNALLQDNMSTYRDDVSAIGLMGTEKRFETMSLAQDALVAKSGVRPLLKAKQSARNLETLSSVGSQLAEVGTGLGSKKSKGRNILKEGTKASEATATRAKNYEKLRKSLLGKEYGY